MRSQPASPRPIRCGVVQPAQGARVGATAHLARQRRAAAHGAEQVDQVDPARAAGVRRRRPRPRAAGARAGPRSRYRSAIAENRAAAPRAPRTAACRPPARHGRAGVVQVLRTFGPTSRAAGLVLDFALGQVGQRAQLLDRAQGVEVAVAHRHLAARVARVDDEQVLVGIAQPRGAAAARRPLGLAVRDAHAADVDQVEVAAAAVTVGIDLGAVGGHARYTCSGRGGGGMRSSSGPGRHGDALLDGLGQVGELLPAIAVVVEHRRRAGPARRCSSARRCGELLAHLAHLRAQLQQIERHRQVTAASVRQPRSEPTSSRWRTSHSSISSRPSSARPLEPRDLAVVDAFFQPEIVDGPTHGFDQDGLADRAVRDDDDRLPSVVGHGARSRNPTRAPALRASVSPPGRRMRCGRVGPRRAARRGTRRRSRRRSCRSSRRRRSRAADGSGLTASPCRRRHFLGRGHRPPEVAAVDRRDARRPAAPGPARAPGPRPRSVSGESDCPCQRPSTLNTVSPWRASRIRTGVPAIPWPV